MMRRLEHLILSPLFERLWKDSDEGLKDAATKRVFAGDLRGLKAWMRNHPSIDLGEKSVRTLREIGQRQGIANYSRLTKVELMSAIREREAHEKDGHGD